MPRFDGPYLITDTHNEASMVTLDIPTTPNVFPTFHSSLVKPFLQNDDTKFPSRTLEMPRSIEVDGQEEFFMDHIINYKKVGHRFQYLVCWHGEAPGKCKGNCRVKLNQILAGGPKFNILLIK